ncbi:MAG: DegQ family serine endoprotease [Candidatus Binatia bacterium]
MEEKVRQQKRVELKGFIKLALASLLGGLVVTSSLNLSWHNGAARFTGEAQATSHQSEAQSPQGLPDFVSLAKRLTPMVVNISTTQSSGGGQQIFPSPFGEQDPFSEFWKRFFGDPLPRGPFRQKSLGSGFVINRDGFILTNNHVVENSEKIVVKLSDGREFQAEIIGRDAKTDIAVIKIDADNDLPTAPLGDSDRLEVGEWVLAIGNPFGLEHSVTSGIVSAKGRHIGAGPYDNFIQTDASINPGNSGGPLMNLRGEVVGINTAIFSRGGGNIGIGFAIPINLAKELLPQLKSKGKVTRGWLGVVIQKVTPAIAESLGLDKARGALVANVSKDAPADKAGIKVGDVIIEFDKRSIKESNDLPIIVARTPIGKKVPVKVLRDGKKLVLSVAIGELKEEEVFASVQGGGNLGLTVQKVTPQIAESLGLDRAEGVVVTLVDSGSPGEDAGIRRGDVILEVDRKSIRNIEDYRKSIAKIKKGKGVLFLVRRGETTLFLALKSPK